MDQTDLISFQVILDLCIDCTLGCRCRLWTLA